MENLFKGVGTALITPFQAGGDIDFASLEQIVADQLRENIDFLCVLGSTAETPCLSQTEKLEVKNFVVDVVKGQVPILLGMGGNNTRNLVESLQTFDMRGVDGILSVCPYYNKPSQEGIYLHFREVSKATKLPIVVYNVPGRTGTNMAAQTTLRINRDLPNVVAIKEASAKMNQIEEVLNGKTAGFDVLSGDDSLALELIAMGATGVISVIANALPGLYGSLVHEALHGNYAAALNVQEQLKETYRLLSVDGNPSGIKSLMALQGRCENELRLPLVPARRDTQQALKRQWEKLIGVKH